MFLTDEIVRGNRLDYVERGNSSGVFGHARIQFVRLLAREPLQHSPAFASMVSGLWCAHL
jgi:hypothetical protein